MSELSPLSSASPPNARGHPDADQHHDEHHDDVHHQQQHEIADESPDIDRGGRFSTRTPPKGAYRAVSPSQSRENARERNLMELLSKAAAEIRVERRKVKQLLDENERLKDEVKTLKSRHVQQQRQQVISAASREATEAKQRYSDLMTVHKALTVELEQTKEQLRTYQSRCREQQRALQTAAEKVPVGGSAAVRSESPGTAGYANRHGGRTSSATRQQPASARAAPVARSQSLAGRTSDAKRAPSATQRAGSTNKTETHFDAMLSVKMSRSPPRTGRTVMTFDADRSTGSAGASAHPRAAAPSPAAHYAAGDSGRKPATQPHGMQRSASAPHNESAASSQRETLVAAEERQFNDMMLSRLRRAIAPPPTKEQMAEVVHAMVAELVKSCRRAGLKLELRRVGPCLYEAGRRRMHLTVDSRRLVVKCGGGHVDINEFIQRNRLWSQLPQSEQPEE